MQTKNSSQHSEKAIPHLTHNLRKSLKTPPPQAEKAHPIWLQEETYARTRPLRMQSPSIHMLIISCFFNEMENACGIESSDENSFTYQIEQTTFDLPNVRFNYDVSPPPPPPQRLPLYDKLIDQDPRGFQMAQTLLADIFPRLEHVATSSVGATVGAYIADFELAQNMHSPKRSYHPDISHQMA